MNMSTYSSLSKMHECFVPTGFAAQWANRPVLDERLERRGQACLDRLVNLIPNGSFMVLRVLRVSEPPKSIEIELHRVLPETGGHRIKGKMLPPSQLASFESHCAELIAIATELADRWPAHARPPSLALITDGKILAFNPGCPECASYGWLKEHLSGASPCVPILGEAAHPFAIPRMAHIIEEGVSN